MRRIVTWLLSTVSALVLLFSYHTSTSSSMPVSVAGAAEPRHVRLWLRLWIWIG